ncbi:MAG: valine--tRNA ligase, partial [Actinomycetota bacterium]|nr:valine--tRNA ligase [Actinomycetota bacterium]
AGTDETDIDELTDAVDLAMLARLDEVIGEASQAFAGFDYARALERTETFFWWFCDDYVELVKGRAYASRGEAAAASARAALQHALDALTRLFAPVLPYATEEAWSWWHDVSVHSSSWPMPIGRGGDARMLDAAIDVLGRVRRAKTEAKRSQRSGVVRLVVDAPDELHERLAVARDDLAEAGSIKVIEVRSAPALSIEIELDAEPAS